MGELEEEERDWEEGGQVQGERSKDVEPREREGSWSWSWSWEECCEEEEEGARWSVENGTNANEEEGRVSA